eukprot:4986823-Prymnesium_polylepis.1
MVHHAVSCRIGAHLTASGASDRIRPHRAASGRIGAPRRAASCFTRASFYRRKRAGAPFAPW